MGFVNENVQQNIVCGSIDDNIQIHQVSITLFPKSIMNEMPKLSILISNSIWVKNSIICFDMKGNINILQLTGEMNNKADELVSVVLQKFNDHIERIIHK